MPRELIFKVSLAMSTRTVLVNVCAPHSFRIRPVLDSCDPLMDIADHLMESRASKQLVGMH